MNSLSRPKLPALTTEQMREVDRVMVEDLHIELVQMMENAGRGLAELAIDRFSPGSVTVLAGPGGNGGGGPVGARHLANRGCQVQVMLSEPGRLTRCPPTRLTFSAAWASASPSRSCTASTTATGYLAARVRDQPHPRPVPPVPWGAIK